MTHVNGSNDFRDGRRRQLHVREELVYFNTVVHLIKPNVSLAPPDVVPLTWDSVIFPV